MNPNIWGKPVGRALFLYKSEESEWTCWFIGAGEVQKPCVWSSQNYKEGDFKEFIIECETRHSNIESGRYADFAFTSLTDDLNFL